MRPGGNRRDRQRRRGHTLRAAGCGDRPRTPVAERERRREKRRSDRLDRGGPTRHRNPASRRRRRGRDGRTPREKIRCRGGSGGGELGATAPAQAVALGATPESVPARWAVASQESAPCGCLRRQAAHNRLANGAYHWARVAVQRDPRSRRKSTALRARGHGHALRSATDRRARCSSPPAPASKAIAGNAVTPCRRVGSPARAHQSMPSTRRSANDRFPQSAGGRTSGRSGANPTPTLAAASQCDLRHCVGSCQKLSSIERRTNRNP